MPSFRKGWALYYSSLDSSEIQEDLKSICPGNFRELDEGGERRDPKGLQPSSSHWIRSTWVPVLLLVSVIPAPHSQSCPVLFYNNFPFFWICFPLQRIIAPLIHVPDLNLNERYSDSSFSLYLQQHCSPAPQRTPRTTDKGRPLCLSFSGDQWHFQRLYFLK